MVQRTLSCYGAMFYIRVFHMSKSVRSDRNNFFKIYHNLNYEAIGYVIFSVVKECNIARSKHQLLDLSDLTEIIFLRFIII